MCMKDENELRSNLKVFAIIYYSWYFQLSDAQRVIYILENISE